MVPDDFRADIQGMRIGSDVHFTLSLLLQNPYGGYMPPYLPPLLSLYSDSQAHALKPKFRTAIIYIPSTKH